MQRVDGVIQYENQAMRTGQSMRTVQTQGEYAVSREGVKLPRGTVFEGVVTQAKDGYVTLSLNNGQTMQARLESGVSVRLGEPVLFEVKSNQDNQISIRQVPVASEYNPTLQKALTAAGLPLTPRNLQMVDIMMQKQLPIDKSSLLAMARTVQGHPQANMETLVQMKKLNFPITDSSLAQFEAYKGGEHALVERFSQIMEQLPELLGGTDGDAHLLYGIKEEILKTLELLPDEPGAEGALKGTEQPGTRSPGMAASDVLSGMAGETNLKAAVSEAETLPAAVGTNGSPEEASAAGIQRMAATEEAMLSAGKILPGAESEVGVAQASPHAVGTYLTEGDWTLLEQQLGRIPGVKEDGRIFAEGELNRNLSARELLGAVFKHLNSSQETGTAMQELFRSREYKGLLRQAMAEQWLLEPEQAGTKENIDKLYDRIHRQMAGLDQLLGRFEGKMSDLRGEVSQVRGNLEMMQQINHLFNYVQIPLKLQAQNAHSDLYVYTNKKKLLDREGELSALLHLELEHLGSTDVHVKMLGTNVTTHFYLADDSSLLLIEQYIGELTERLESKGYHCNVQLEKQADGEHKMDIVEDFLEREAPVGKLQRYSFDVKA